MDQRNKYAIHRRLARSSTRMESMPLRAASVAMAIAVGLTTIVPTPAIAATSAEIRAQLSSAKSKRDDLYEQAEQASEALNDAQTQLDQTNASIETTQGDIDAKTTEIINAKAQLTESLRHGYKDDSTSDIISILANASSISDFTQSLTAALKVTNDTNGKIATVQEQQKELKEKEEQLRREKEQLDREAQTLADQSAEVSDRKETERRETSVRLMLLEREELSPDAARYAAVIRERTEAMRSLCEELFRYSLVSSEDEQMHPEVLSLSAALQESFAAAYTMLKERGITPEISLPETEVQRTLDRAALMRIFSNLLSNAAKYSDGDLRVTLSADGTICFENAASALSEVEVGRLFDRFFTVDSARKSTGLGLAISRTLTERMGGSISASLTDGRLTIRLSFPK